MKMLERGAMSKFVPEQVVLSDRAIKEIISKKQLKHVVTPAGLHLALTRAKVDVDSNVLREKDIVEMFNMIDSAFEMLERGNLRLSRWSYLSWQCSKYYYRFNAFIRKLQCHVRK